MNSGSKRKKKDVINNNNNNKNDEVKEIVTSLILLENEEKIDKQEFDEIINQEKSNLELNHKKKTQKMDEYYSEMQNYYQNYDVTDRLRSKKQRVGLNSAVTISTSEIISKIDKNVVKKKGSEGVVSHQRRLWVKDRSKAWWDECNSPEFSETEFRKYFRMGKKTFEEICEDLKGAIAKEDTMLRAAIPVKQRVAVCIYRLATGEPLRLVSKRFGLGISTCHKLVLEVCQAIRNVLMPKYLVWPGGEGLRRVEDEFERCSGVPCVVGSVYTSHIPIIAPKISVAAYFNKRHTERNQKTSYSITVQGVVDVRGVFTDICIGWPGSMSDDKVLEKSALFQRGMQGLLKGVWVVGGPSFPLMDWVLVPYGQSNLTWTQHAFNEKVGVLHKVAKDAFARLKGRWCCLQKRTEVKLQELPMVLGACCVLHNICEIRGEEMDADAAFELFDDEMMPEIPIQSITALKARDGIAHNLLHHGLGGTAFL